MFLCQLIQVTIESVRLVTSDTITLVGEWKPDGGRTIDVVSRNASQIVVASLNEIFYMCIEDGSLVEKCRRILPYQVACLDITPLDEKQNKSDLVAVGLWTDISAVMLSLPDLETICTEKLSGKYYMNDSFDFIEYKFFKFSKKQYHAQF